MSGFISSAGENYLLSLVANAQPALPIYYFGLVKKESSGNDRMTELMVEIQKGAKAFLKQEYTYVAVFVAVMAVPALGAIVLV